jgi:hypothetical protein
MSESYKPRFIFEVDEELKNRADRLLNQHGIRKAIFTIILEDTLDLIEEYGWIAIGAMMSKKAKPRDIIPSMRKAKEVGEK